MGSSHGKILVVAEDELTIRLVADGLLEQKFQVLEARSSNEARRMLRMAGTLAMLITDLDLAGASGIDIAARARAIFPAIPVLFVSTRDEAVEATQHAIDQDEFARPYGVMALHEARNRLLGSRSPIIAAPQWALVDD
jgi:DNA-binding response OmpR family regulator